jgi:hypothetical protein
MARLWFGYVLPAFGGFVSPSASLSLRDRFDFFIHSLT